MNKEREARIKKFMSDVETANAVREMLTKSFLRKRERSDIYMAAAERLAIDLLEDAWRELEKIKGQDESEKRDLSQVGL